jgi:hypothetical protein
MYIETRSCGLHRFRTQSLGHAVGDIDTLKARLAVTLCLKVAVLCRYVALALNMDTNIVSDCGVSKHRMFDSRPCGGNSTS